MAKQQRKAGIQNTSKVESRSFQKGMVKDVNESIMPEGAYLNARNAVNNSRSGDMGIISNEPSNEFCTTAPYTIIGTIHMYGDKWAIYSTNDVDSEVGIFDESKCLYTRVVNDPCLAFKKINLIIGVAKENFDCTWQTYWSDSVNPDRSMNMDNPPFIEDCETVDDCRVCTPTTDLDCDRIRMARLVTPPCFTLEQGPNGGELLNGTYQAVIAYTENEQRVSDYSSPSNPISLFDHRNINGSLDIVISSIDTTYDEFELVIIGVVNQRTVATKMGIYSTQQNRISIDSVSAQLPTIPLRFLPLDTPAYEKSDGIYRNGEYILRVAPTSRFSFNYQPLANNIVAEWVAVKYNADYYRKAGADVGYLRDEQYPFFIRWIYDTYDKSESYHIPGRAPNGTDFDIIATPGYADPEIANGITPYRWRVENTASGPVPITGTTANGGTIIYKGLMGYWESSEIYPDDKPEIWANLCGKPIRHHKMPDNEIVNHFDSGTGEIIVLGVQFSNIPFPVDNDGIDIPGIIGYEILRGSREGNKTVIAKGLLNNMGKYTREDTLTDAYYGNYPYNDLRKDPFLANQYITGDNPSAAASLGIYDNDKFTFHSPDTQLKHPFLSSRELKVYSTVYGNVEGKFDEPYLHPEHKLVTNAAFILAALVGFGIAYMAVHGEVKRTRSLPSNTGIGFVGLAGTTAVADVAAGINVPILWNSVTGADTAINAAGLKQLLQLAGYSEDETPDYTAAVLAFSALAAQPAVSGGTYVDEYSPYGNTGLPLWLRISQAIPSFITYWGEGTDKTLEIIKNTSRWRQYALQFQSHCFHNKSNTDNSGRRVVIKDASYIGDGLQEFGGVTVNNLFRGASLGLITEDTIPDSTVPDTSRKLASDIFNTVADIELGKEQITGVASAHYTGLKTRLANQYGQIDGIIQVPTSSCTQAYIIDPEIPTGAKSEIIFGGDTYIGRWTEKNTFFYFSDWMYDLPDGFEYDYKLRKMMPFPTYWMDTNNFDLNTFFGGLIGSIGAASGTVSIVPSNFHNFERGGGGGGFFSGWNAPFVIKDAYMYLFNSGVRDFYVESEVNVEYRDWEDQIENRHYDPHLFKDYAQLFRSDRVKEANLFKYDYTLSVSRLYQNFASWGTVQYRNYDPEVAETCYTYYPNRVIYSLPQNKELRYDNWLVYLINNFKDFTSRVTAIKPIGKNGAMILFENEAPVNIPGVDTLQTTDGTKITIGDGGLFSQPLQNLVNVETPYEYGSCQDRLSVINTPAGLFWISRNQGKIFSFTGQLTDISQEGMKWWFEEYLRFKILQDFPTFEVLNNPVVGVGCQSIYNNNDGIVYFSKTDFRVKPEYRGRITYTGGLNFELGAARFLLGDDRYFDDASWTISYDPKQKAWISFHDWNPDLMIPGKNSHMTTKNAAIWIHNDRSDSYCNFYGDDFPFEVDMVTPTGQSVNTLKSIEYLMEVYQWDDDETDRFHVLDFNFDRAIVYNTEQVSGELRLNLTPKNNAPALNNYPAVNASSIDILFSKVEQKYRFNQFWDITDDRGEFTTAARRIWITEPNGYIKNLNPVNLDYFKPLHQRKKFRHYEAYLKLVRRVSGPNNMHLKIVNSKNQYSMR